MTITATSGRNAERPSVAISAEPPRADTACEMARPIVWPLGKSDALVSVPCQLIVHPPACIAILSAPEPAIRTRAPLRMGRVDFSFFSRTSDLDTASRAKARWSAAPTNAVFPRCVGIAPIRPSLNFTRKLRRTASSMRAIGIRPSFAAANVESKSPFQLSGAMKRSRPALIACGQFVAEQPGIWPWPFQSPTIRPAKPIRPFKTSVRRVLLP